MLILDRFFFVYKPFRYERLVTSRRTLLAIGVLCWAPVSLIVACFYAFPEAYTIRFSPLVLGCTSITDHETQYAIVLTILLHIPFLVGIAFNVWLAFIALKNIRAVYKTQKRSQPKLQRRMSSIMVEDFMKNMRKKKQLHLASVIGGIVLSHTVAWATEILVVYVAKYKVAEPLQVVADVLYASQVMLHPFIKTLLIVEVRESFKKVLARFCKGSGKTDSNSKCTEASSPPPPPKMVQQVELEKREEHVPSSPPATKPTLASS